MSPIIGRHYRGTERQTRSVVAPRRAAATRTRFDLLVNLSNVNCSLPRGPLLFLFFLDTSLNNSFFRKWRFIATGFELNYGQFVYLKHAFIIHTWILIWHEWNFCTANILKTDFAVTKCRPETTSRWLHIFLFHSGMVQISHSHQTRSQNPVGLRWIQNGIL